MNQADEDAEHLRLLSIFHYVVAGIQALWASFPVLHLAIGLGMVFAPAKFGVKSGDSQEHLFGWFFVLFAGAWIVLGWTLAVCLVVAGRSLSQRKRRLFCLVTAGVTAAICMPFGTVLGIFTIIVLMRPSVKELFEHELTNA